MRIQDAVQHVAHLQVRAVVAVANDEIARYEADLSLLGSPREKLYVVVQAGTDQTSAQRLGLSSPAQHQHHH